MTKRRLNEFCRCIKKVRKTVKARPDSSKESAAIGICVKSVLQTRGRTLRKFRCTRRKGRSGKPFLQTQKLVGGGRHKRRFTRSRRTSLPTIPEELETSNAENVMNRKAEALTFAKNVALLNQQHTAQAIAREALRRAGVSLTKPLWVTPHHSTTG